MVNYCDEAFQKLTNSFNPKTAGNLEASFLFDISGENGGKWSILINKGTCTLSKNEITNPSVKISMLDKDWIEIYNGSLNSQMAFMLGKLRIDGDMSLALKLQSLFPGPS